VAGNGDVRERHDVLIDLFEADRIQLLVPILSIHADHAGNREEDDCKYDEETQHQAECIEEMPI